MKRRRLRQLRRMLAIQRVLVKHGLDEIVWWVLGMGPSCVVKRPKELATRVKELAEQVAQRYS